MTRTRGLRTLLATAAALATAAFGPAFGPAAAAQSPAADSLRIAAALAAWQADSVRAFRRAADSARAALDAPVAFARSSAALTPAARALLNGKAWLLYENDGVRVTLVGRADDGLDEPAARAQAGARVDSVRAYLLTRGVALDRVGVSAAGGPVRRGATVDVASAGQLRVVDTPPADVTLPAPAAGGGHLSPSDHRAGAWGVVRVFYATDRARAGASDADPVYGAERAPGGALEFGRVEVTVPRLHRPGVVEQAAWYQLDRSPDPSRQMLLRSVRPLDQRSVLDSIRRVAAGGGKNQVLVFIHGYNVAFQDAALRTAQLTYDLGFEGVPVLYSWPSRGSVWGYVADRESAHWSAHHLRVFLDSVVAATGAARVHVIAHSMGNYVLTLALGEMAAARARAPQAGAPAPPAFDNLVLAAADVDAAEFTEQIAPSVRPLARRLTLYLSANDKALWTSRLLSTHPRLGESTSPMLVVRGTDTIDATAVHTDLLGHGYVASSRAVIDDLVALIGRGLAPPRGSLRALSGAGGAYWQFP